MSEFLPVLLKTLRLPTVALHYQAFQTEATEKAWGYTRYLEKLCEQEVASRYKTRVQTWTRAAKLPRRKSFATLKAQELPTSVQTKVLDLRDNTEWALQAESYSSDPRAWGNHTSRQP